MLPWRSVASGLSTARIRARPEELGSALRLLPEAGFLGANLTIPHKTAALAFLDHVDEHALGMGAVNTVLANEDRLTGFNTDGPGLVRAIKEEFGADVRDLRILILGAGGGAGRAIACQCALEGCIYLGLVNRTYAKAHALEQQMASRFKESSNIEAVPWDEDALRCKIKKVDLIINATSRGMESTDASLLPSELLHPKLLVYDTIYSANRTSLLKAADEAGARGANGLSMLLHQGALSFEIWFNRPAPLDTMRAALLNREPARSNT